MQFLSVCLRPLSFTYSIRSLSIQKGCWLQCLAH